MEQEKKDLVRGSLIGGAAGDALGYTVEFMRYNQILQKYGHPGITDYELRGGAALISDDTQMTLFTANGMLMGLTRHYMRGIGSQPHFYVLAAYLDWYYTQTRTYHDIMDASQHERHSRHTWLSAIPTLYARRAPGYTCMSAIEDIIHSRTAKNDSKGCGGVMRVAPWPLLCATQRHNMSVEMIDMAGGEIARLTHKHPLGWMPAMVMTHVIYRILGEAGFKALQPGSQRERLCQMVDEALDMLPTMVMPDNIHTSELTWPADKPFGAVFAKDIQYLSSLLKKALLLAENDAEDIDNIRLLGEGWVAEETLAIALYAVSRHIDNFADCMIASVNHDGDSDSTGAVAGNILGAIIGYEAIPARFKQNLELHDVILAVADDLHQGCIVSEYDYDRTPEKQQWLDRYCDMQPAGIKI